MGQHAKTRHEEMNFFQGLPYKGPVFTKTVITLSSGAHFGPTSTQNARDECGNLENTSILGWRAEETSNSAPKQDFFRRKVKEHHLPLIFRKVSKPIGTPSEGNPRYYGQYKH